MHVVYLVAERPVPYWGQLTYSACGRYAGTSSASRRSRIIGHCPPGVEVDQVLPTVQDGDKSANVSRAMKVLVDTKDLPNRVMLLDTDMFPLHPTRPRIVGGDARKLLEWARRERSPDDPPPPRGRIAGGDPEPVAHPARRHHGRP